MSIYSYEGRYIVTYSRRGEFMRYSCKTINEAQAKLKEMAEEAIVELTHRRYYFQPDKVMILHYPKG
jgi:hypothetical protein